MDISSRSDYYTGSKFNALLKNVYLWMSASLFLTAAVAWAVGSNQRLMIAFHSSILFTILIVMVQFALVYILSARINTMTISQAVLAFIGYSVCTGASLSVIFAVYTKAAIAQAFIVSAFCFLGGGLYAFFSKENTNRGISYLIMGLCGIMAISLVNIFIRSTRLEMLISVAGVIIFIALTAYDTKKINNIYNAYCNNIDEDSFIRLSITCALSLYLDFINIFLYIIRIIGLSGSRDRK